MIPDHLFTLGCAMTPELVDQTILACCHHHSRKVARVIGDVAPALNVQVQYPRLMFDIPDDAEIPPGLPEDFIANRIKALVEAGKLRGFGDLDRWRFSEVALSDPPKA
jgi:Protein of unknown function